jgi:hypothetical protein
MELGEHFRHPEAMAKDQFLRCLLYGMRPWIVRVISYDNAGNRSTSNALKTSFDKRAHAVTAVASTPWRVGVKGLVCLPAILGQRVRHIVQPCLDLLCVLVVNCELIDRVDHPFVEVQNQNLTRALWQQPKARQVDKRKSNRIPISNKSHCLVRKPSADQLSMQQHVGNLHVDLIEKPQGPWPVDDDVG